MRSHLLALAWISTLAAPAPAARLTLASRAEPNPPPRLAGPPLPCSGEQQVFGPQPEDAESFGYAVALEGDTLVVGAPVDNDGLPLAGAVHVFERAGASWVLQQTLIGSDAGPGQLFGRGVAISGDMLAVSALDHVHVFARSGGTWTEQQILTSFAPLGGENFGQSIAIDDATLVVGDPAHDLLTGAVLVYTLAAGQWSPQQYLSASNGERGDQFGCSVAIDGDTIVAGAMWADRACGFSCGAAYVFERSGGAWIERQELEASDGEAYLLGSSVAVHGDTAAIGASSSMAGGIRTGAAYVFGRSAGTWTEQQKLWASDGTADDDFGRVIALDGDGIVVGTLDDAAGLAAGAAYLFVRTGGDWVEAMKLMASDAAPSAGFGTSVAISGATIACGAFAAQEDAGSFGGVVYTYACDVPVPELTCSAGPDIMAGCDGVSLADAMVIAANGVQLEFQWTSSCPGVIFLPGADALNPIAWFGSECGVQCELQLDVMSASGATCSDSVMVNVDDATPPRIEPSGSDDRCLWPPDHSWACYSTADFHPLIEDDCAAPATWEFIDCASDQHPDRRGDGRTEPDCVVGADGDWFCVRAERDARDGNGRTYAVRIRATDTCGNTSEASIARIHVPRDNREQPSGARGERRRDRRADP